MAFEVPGFSLGNLVAAADLSAKQYTVVTVNSSSKIAAITAATTIVAGVLQNKPKADEAAEVMVCGVTKILAGAAVTAGAEVMSDSTGRAITAATAANRAFGVALETATAANQLISVLIGFHQRVI